FSYDEASAVISNLSNHLSEQGLYKNDKISILSENRAEWGMCWLAITTIGCTAVPIMTDFSEEQICSILEHSEAKYIFVSKKLLPKINESELVKNNNFIIIDDNPLFDKTDNLYKQSIDIVNANEPDDIAALIYTSGTTGTSKGVLLSHKNIMTNTCDSVTVGKFERGDSMLSVLPLSHMYEFTQGFMLPMIEGANITYLGMKPSPTLMLKAIAEVRPHYILSVPLLIEKIYKSSVLQQISKNAVLNFVYKIPPLRMLLNRFVIGKKLSKTFGGRLKFFGIGGAPLSETVERFLREARFPYAIGYGLTETSPVLACSGAFKTIFRAVGPALKNVKLRISGEGEIQASGDSVMQGYFKDPEKTSQVFTKDGWFKTGDLGLIDKRGTLFIKGRLKNLILGPAGENIYPEEIENELKANPLVAECIVLKQQAGLVARVFLDQDKLKQYLEEIKLGLSNLQAEKEAVLENLRKSINKNLSNFSRLSQIIEQEIPFELTPSLKVKRFLYT
ncbi:MAG: AMP-binding protein, partial [Spirochaetales bacterium]|nr:AMP-binding protein [Spirochaetales bacterium]